MSAEHKPHSTPLVMLREFFKANAMSESPQMLWLDDLEEQLEAEQESVERWKGWYEEQHEQFKTVTKQRDAIMSMLEAERPPEEVFAYARSLSSPSGYPEVSAPASGPNA